MKLLVALLYAVSIGGGLIGLAVASPGLAAVVAALLAWVMWFRKVK